VALAPSGDAEEMAEGVVGHGAALVSPACLNARWLEVKGAIGADRIDATLQGLLIMAARFKTEHFEVL
jgi:hypothetical protein